MVVEEEQVVGVGVGGGGGAADEMSIVEDVMAHGLRSTFPAISVQPVLD